MGVEQLKGKTLSDIIVSHDEIHFIISETEQYKLYHRQNCCESVTIEDICGDIRDLVGSPILMAEEATSNENPNGIIKKYQDSFTWTFYKFATLNGYVTIRWYGASNGYYSEKVNFACLENGKWETEW